MRLFVVVVGVAAALGVSATAVRPPAESDTQSPKHVRTDSLVQPMTFAPSLSEGFDSDRAFPHPHGDQVCASGCALSRHPTQRLTSAEFHALLDRLRSDPVDQQALDHLAYFGRQAAVRLRSLKPDDLHGISSELLDRLRHELNRQVCRVQIRIVALDGRTLADLPVQQVPLDVRHEFDLVEHGLPDVVASGTVKRVGVNRLWTRL